MEAGMPAYLNPTGKEQERNWKAARTEPGS
jgi:hypothetical protein